ncbi:prepilin-type N-terminal cleavage/methylation domain-containing protein [Thalassotalea euphylliae]|uniref:Prepilin-type N-terminal cleavage/methylation domain-containing protein n=1 Tax=Thalassotalea euphylliae TaxID=1655234 RepID=A0A3E0TP29_9GAMM|nr:prepilin-type N-terminal cleavage/methylation domain-containing protein [Thalassotalea euphylliae]REL26107.1 prepilin-type N-terminal cleavage/methylation domain-containing protein [Thalassotalea euphylliae]
MGEVKRNLRRTSKPRTQNRGFTLIELLIVTFIISLLLFTGGYAYSLFTNKWQEEIGQFDQVKRFSVGLERLRMATENISPLVIFKDNKQPAFFFIGDKESLLAITHNGLFNFNFPEAFRLTVLTKPSGKKQLLYQALSLEGFAILTESQSIDFERQQVLIDDVDDISFSYYGWSSFFDKKGRTADNLIGELAWSTRFSGLDRVLMPEKIELTITNENQKLNLITELDSSVEEHLRTYFDQEAN